MHARWSGVARQHNLRATTSRVRAPHARSADLTATRRRHAPDPSANLRAPIARISAAPNAATQSSVTSSVRPKIGPVMTLVKPTVFGRPVLRSMKHVAHLPKDGGLTVGPVRIIAGQIDVVMQP